MFLRLLLLYEYDSSKRTDPTITLASSEDEQNMQRSVAEYVTSQKPTEEERRGKAERVAAETRRAEAESRHFTAQAKLSEASLHRVEVDAQFSRYERILKDPAMPQDVRDKAAAKC